MKNTNETCNFFYEASSIESEVYCLLASVKSDNENVTHINSSIDAPFDIEIKQGLSRLDIPENFYVEVKMNVMFDTLERIRQNILHFKEKHDDINGILIVYKQSKYPDSISDKYTKELAGKIKLDIRSISLESLRQKVMNIKGNKVVVNSENLEIESWEIRRNDLLDNAKDDVRLSQVSLFLGAGVSADAGLVSWDGLLKCLVNKRSRSVITKRDLSKIKKANFDSSLIIGRYIKCADSTLDIFTSVRNILYKNHRHSNLVDSICRFINSGSVESVITYNYDMLVEDRMNELFTHPNVKVSPVFENNRIGKDCVPVYHVHGVIPNPSTESSFKPYIVLAEDDYHKLYMHSYDWSNIEQLHALDRNVCFFIGLSMSDPNLRRLLDFSHAKQEEDKPTHYAFLKRNLFGKIGCNDKDLENWRILESMFSSLGVNIIWYEDYADLPDLIDRLCR